MVKLVYIKNIEFAQSKCCKSPIKVMPEKEGIRTRWYECQKCLKPCDAEPKEKNGT